MFMRSGRQAFAGLMTAALVIGCGRSEAAGADQPVEVCEVDVDDTACDVCIKTGCCDAYSACQKDAKCTCVLACAEEGQPRATCATRCKVSDAEISDVIATLSGADRTCTVQCDDECAVYGFTPF